MSDRDSTRGPQPAGSWLTISICGLLAASLTLRLLLMLRLNINWDEFHYLSFVYRFLRQEPLAWRQTFHVHIFPWLTSIQPDEVAQIIAARISLIALGVATSGLVYWIGRRFLSPAGSLFSVLCYNALSEVVVHGASFRPDPLATFLVLAASAAALARRSPRLTAALAGALLALSFMLTLKTVFFVPGVAILALARRAGDPAAVGRRLGRLAIVAASGLAAVTLLWLFHRQMIVPQASDASQAATIGRIGAGILWSGYWFPGRFYLLRSLTQNALVWTALAAGLALALAGRRQRAAAGRRLLPLAGLALPLATLIFYRNSFPYYLAMILAPAVPLCGVAFDRLRALEPRLGRLGPLLLLAVALGVFATGVTNYLRQLPFGMQGQRQLVETVHRMFPEPVPYLDRCSMIASFPKVGFFMSTWGMERYARTARPVLAEAVRDHAPPLLIANTLPLNPALSERGAAKLRYRLLPEDRRVLSRSYIQHWGIIFVAGRHLELVAGDNDVAIEIPGSYTVEGEIEVVIDGRAARPGDVVELTAGSHRVAAETGGRLTLRWGDHLYRPDGWPAREPIFIGL